MPNCKDCGGEFKTASNRRPICLACRRIHDKKWRDFRKQSGNPVPQGKPNAEWKIQYDKNYSQNQEVKIRKAANARLRVRDVNERHKHLARWATRRAIASGRLIKQPCWSCGSVDVEAHHYDYSTPLGVTWLCRPHHRQLHTEFSAAGAV